MSGNHVQLALSARQLDSLMKHSVLNVPEDTIAKLKILQQKVDRVMLVISVVVGLMINHQVEQLQEMLVLVRLAIIVHSRHKNPFNVQLALLTMRQC